MIANVHRQLSHLTELAVTACYLSTLVGTKKSFQENEYFPGRIQQCLVNKRRANKININQTIRTFIN